MAQEKMGNMEQEALKRKERLLGLKRTAEKSQEDQASGNKDSNKKYVHSSSCLDC